MAKAKKAVRKRAQLGHFNHDVFMKNVGKRIKALRKEKEFTSAETFAYDIEISRISLAKYEALDFHDMQMRTLLKIIDGLGMTPTEFFSKGFD